MGFQARFAFIGFLFTALAWAPALKAEEVRIKHSGLTLNAQLNLADGKALKDGAVLLVHGTLAHNGMDTIKNLIEVLNERGLNTLAINLSLGVDDRHGMYDCKVTHRHKHLDALDEITAWFGWLKSKGAGDVVLFGHSRGGNQAARFATEKGDALLKRLVLLAPATWDQAAADKGFKKRHGQPLSGQLAMAQARVKAGKGDDIMKGVGLLYCAGADVIVGSFVSYYKPDPRFDTPAILPELKIPTLLIAGGKDNVVKGLPGRVKPQADGKRLHFAVVDDAGHFFLDLFAEDVADEMEAFLSPDS